jgi:GNAT superfamily N-acetyltransferase
MKKNFIFKEGKSTEIVNFWQMVGPYFSSKKVVAEIGSCIYDDKQTYWFVFHDHLWNLVGFGAVRIRREKCILGSTYVVGKHRNLGVYQKLLEKQLKTIDAEIKCKQIEITTKNEYLIRVLERNGFEVHHTRGSYSVMYNIGTILEPKKSKNM